jgi:hypothetical protein
MLWKIAQHKAGKMGSIYRVRYSGPPSYRRLRQEDHLSLAVQGQPG